LQPSTKEATKKSIFPDVHTLVPYFTWFNLLYIQVQKRKESGKEISNSALLEVRFRMFITMPCPVRVGFVEMSEY